MFALPWMLGFLALGAVPIIIHLIFRQRYRRIEWAAMDFLLAAIKRTRRRLRLEHLLLLILRVLAVLLLVLAAAVPTFSPQGADLGRSGTRHTVLILDTSTSMGYLEDPASGSRYAKALATAREIVGRLREGDALSIIAATDQALPLSRTAYTHAELDAPGKVEVIFSSQKLAPSSRPSSITPALAQASVELATTSKTYREVVVITDLQRSAWLRDEEDGAGSAVSVELNRLHDEARASVTILDVGRDEWHNLVLEDLALPDAVVAAGVPVTLTATVFNPGAVARPEVFVELLVGGPKGGVLEAKISRATGTLPGKERVVVELPHVFLEPGVHRLAARITGDGLAADNVRTLTVAVVESVPVLLVNGQTNQVRTWMPDELGLVEIVLEPEAGAGMFRVSTLDEQNAYALDDLGRFQVIVLGNVFSLASETASALASWVREGGGLLITAGDQVIDGQGAAPFYEQALGAAGADILPARITGVLAPVESGGAADLALTEAGRNHAIFARLKDVPDLFRAYVRKLLRLEVPQRDDTRVLVTTTADPSRGREAAPLVVERRVGAGRVLILGTTADEEWSDMMQSALYPLMVTEMTRTLAARSRANANLLVGQTILASYAGTHVGSALLGIPQPVAPGDIEGRAPPDDVQLTHVPPLAEGDPARARFEYSNTQAPGFYELLQSPRGDGDPELRDAFAVNVDPIEGNLERIGLDAIGALAPGVLVATDIEGLMPAESAGGAFPGWRIFLWLLFVVLIVETILAQRFGSYGARASTTGAR